MDDKVIVLAAIGVFFLLQGWLTTSPTVLLRVLNLPLPGIPKQRRPYSRFERAFKLLRYFRAIFPVAFVIVVLRVEFPHLSADWMMLLAIPILVLIGWTNILGPYKREFETARQKYEEWNPDNDSTDRSE